MAAGVGTRRTRHTGPRQTPSERRREAMPYVPRSPAPLPREQTTITQWCGNCQAATHSVIIEGRTYCAVCQPDGPNWGKDDEDW